MSRVVQNFREQWDVIGRGVAEIIPQEELIQKLKRSIREDKPLLVKLGLDPTAPDIHLGHTVVLHKLRQFQELGHDVVLILGDFTSRIGDPTGRSETRKQLNEEQILKNVATYKDQVGKILNMEKTRVEFNSSWLAPLSFTDVIELAAKYTVARMLEHDDFHRRYTEGIPVGVHEFLYPLMQGYDSVALHADIELGGTDQKFNLLVGRDLQRDYGQEPQIAITVPILEGLDGVQKMSKSLGNYIGISESPQDIYGKAMSIPDELIARYFELVTPVSLKDVKRIRNGLADGSLHPRDAKMSLARTLVSLFHDDNAAQEAEQGFIAVFQKHEMPQEIPEVSIEAVELENGLIWLPKLLVKTGLCDSTSAGKRFITQGAVKMNGERVSDPDAQVAVTDGLILSVGKRRFAQLRLV
jgi:tyrosyl-tRNA synthetase